MQPKLSVSKDQLYEACQGFFRPHHVYTLEQFRHQIANIQASIEKLNEEIKRILQKYQNAIELLKQVPGISTKSAEDLIAEIGLDMNQFPTEKNLASWAGMCPGNNESAGKKKVEKQHKETNK